MKKMIQQISVTVFALMVLVAPAAHAVPPQAMDNQNCYSNAVDAALRELKHEGTRLPSIPEYSEGYAFNQQGKVIDNAIRVKLSDAFGGPGNAVVDVYFNIDDVRCPATDTDVLSNTFGSN